MHLSKHHVCLSKRRRLKEVLLYFKSVSSLAPPYNKLPCSDGSIKHVGVLPSSSSSRLLQINKDLGALHLHTRPASSVLPSIEHVSHGIASGGRRRKAPCVSPIVKDAGTGVCKDNMLKDESTPHLHQNNVEATLSSLEHVKEDMGAAHLPQKNAKKEHAPQQRDMGNEDWSSLLGQHGILPTSFFSVVKALPTRRRTQVHFRNIISLIVLLQTMDINIDFINIRKAPFMYRRDPVVDLQPKIEYLEKLGLHRKEMQCLVLKYPYALYPPLKDIQAQILFLRSIPLRHEDILRILGKAPTVFYLPADKTQAKIEFLRNAGIPEMYIREMLMKYPRIFCNTLLNLEKLISFLQELGLRPGTNLFPRAVKVFGTFKVETLQVNVKTLLDGGFLVEDIQGLVKQAPCILTVNAHNIRNKLDYVVNVMNRSVKEIMKCPFFLAHWTKRYDLDKKQRAAYKKKEKKRSNGQHTKKKEKKKKQRAAEN